MLVEKCLRALEVSFIVQCVMSLMRVPFRKGRAAIILVIFSSVVDVGPIAYCLLVSTC